MASRLMGYFFMNTKKSSALCLDKSVIAGGYCVGCGVCAVPSDSPFEIFLNEQGFYQAKLKVGSHTDTDAYDYTQICPFGANSRTEDELANAIFPHTPKSHKALGRFTKCYAGRVTASDFYSNGSSGGVAKWILYTLLKDKLVDYVIQVFPTKASETGGLLYKFDIIDTIQGVKAGSKSAYYPVELSEVLQQVLNKPARYAITGIPCFLKAVRSLCLTNEILNERITYCIGIICGHMKSANYAKFMAWQLGVQPDKLESFDFRKKIQGAKANEKGLMALDRQGNIWGPEKEQKYVGTDYGIGLFKYKACDYCDDVFAEVADVTIGDAWLPRYMEQGTSMVVVRNPLFDSLFSQYSSDLSLEMVLAGDAAKSQEAGLRHRREGLSYRLWLLKKQMIWVPPKRIKPSKNVNLRYRNIFKYRMMFMQLSNEKFSTLNKNGLANFIKCIEPKIVVYRYLYHSVVISKALGVLEKIGVLSFILPLLLRIESGIKGCAKS